MNETRTSQGNPDLRLLVLIPAVLIIAKAGRHRRAMMEQGWSGPTAMGRHGEPGAKALRLPPRIEAALDAWHTRTHAASDASTPEPSHVEA